KAHREQASLNDRHGFFSFPSVPTSSQRTLQLLPCLTLDLEQVLNRSEGVTTRRPHPGKAGPGAPGQPVSSRETIVSTAASSCSRLITKGGERERTFPSTPPLSRR